MYQEDYFNFPINNSYVNHQTNINQKLVLNQTMKPNRTKIFKKLITNRIRKRCKTGNFTIEYTAVKHCNYCIFHFLLNSQVSHRKKIMHNCQLGFQWRNKILAETDEIS